MVPRNGLSSERVVRLPVPKPDFYPSQPGRLWSGIRWEIRRLTVGGLSFGFEIPPFCRPIPLQF